MEITEVLRLSNYGFYLPRAPRRHESASVHVQIPGFGDDGERDGSMSTFTIPGQVEEEPDGCLVRIHLEDVHESLKGIPPTVTTKFLWATTTRTTKVTFTPFIEPNEE
jgi:hypothetical protein